MLISRANLRVLCYNNERAISLPLRQQHLSTFLAKYKQLNHTYTFKIIFKYVICIQLYTFNLYNSLSYFAHYVIKMILKVKRNIVNVL